MKDYQKFLAEKAIVSVPTGFKVKDSAIPKKMFEFQKVILEWQCRRGRSAEFADCGMMKTLNQSAFAQQVVEETNKPFLLLAPNGVVRQTIREGKKFDVEIILAKSDADIKGPAIYITNYEKLHLFDVSKFGGRSGTPSPPLVLFVKLQPASKNDLIQNLSVSCHGQRPTLSIALISGFRPSLFN